MGHPNQNLREFESADVLVYSCVLFLILRKLRIRLLKNHIQVIATQRNLFELVTCVLMQTESKPELSEIFLVNDASAPRPSP